MPPNAICANSFVIQPKLTYPITMHQQKFQLQPQMILSTTNITHSKIPDLYTLSSINTNVKNYWLLSTNQILSYDKLSFSQLCDDANFPSQTSSKKQKYNPLWQLLNCGMHITVIVGVLIGKRRKQNNSRVPMRNKTQQSINWMLDKDWLKNTTNTQTPSTPDKMD